MDLLRSLARDFPSNRQRMRDLGLVPMAVEHMGKRPGDKMRAILMLQVRPPVSLQIKRNDKCIKGVKHSLRGSSTQGMLSDMTGREQLNDLGGDMAVMIRQGVNNPPTESQRCCLEQVWTARMVLIPMVLEVP